MKYLNWVKKAETPDVENYHILACDESKRKQSAVINLISGFVFFIMIFGAGILNHPSSRTAWIFYPYISTMIPAVYFIAGALAFMKCTVNLSKKQWDSSLGRCSHSAIALLILCILNLILDVIFIIIHSKTGFNFWEIIYLLIFVILTLLCIVYGKFFDKNFAKNGI